jgi:hypothetical protein
MFRFLRLLSISIVLVISFFIFIIAFDSVTVLKSLDFSDYFKLLIISVCISGGIYLVIHCLLKNKTLKKHQKITVILFLIFSSIFINYVYYNYSIQLSKEFISEIRYEPISPHSHINDLNFEEVEWEAKILGTCGYIHFEKLYFLNDTTIFISQKPVYFSSVFPLQYLFDNVNYLNPFNNLYKYKDSLLIWKTGMDSSRIYSKLIFEKGKLVSSYSGIK